MKNRTQNALVIKPERHPHQRAGDLAPTKLTPDVARLFDLGSSGGSNIAQNKGQMVGDAFNFARRNLPSS